MLNNAHVSNETRTQNEKKGLIYDHWHHKKYPAYIASVSDFSGLQLFKEIVREREPIPTEITLFSLLDQRSDYASKHPSFSLTDSPD